MRPVCRSPLALIAFPSVLVAACGYSGLDLGQENAELDGDIVDIQGTGGMQDPLGSGGHTDGLGGAGDGGSATGGRAAGGSGGDGAGGDGTGGEPSSSGGADGAGGSTPCSSDCVDVLVNRTFEFGIAGTPQLTGGGTIQRSTEIVHTGEYSLVATQGIPGSEAEISELIPLRSSGRLFVRAWIYVPDGAITDWVKFFGFNGDSFEGMDVSGLSTEAVEVAFHTQLLEMVSLPAAFPSSEWFCLQVDTWVNDAPFGSMSVSVNEKPVVDLDQVDTRPGTGITDVVFGIAATGAMQTGASIYYDDLAIGYQEIPCDVNAVALPLEDTQVP